MTDGDENGASECLCEEHQRDANGDVFLAEHSLRSQHCLLHAQPHPEPKDDLVSNPLALACREVERRDQSSTDGHQASAGNHERRVVSQTTGGLSGTDRADDEGEHQGDCADAGLNGGDALDRLEPDGDVVHHDHHRRAQAEHEPHRRHDAAVEDDASGKRDVVGVAHPPLLGNEGNEKDSEKNEQGDDAPVGPGIRRSAPLQGQQQTDDAGEEEKLSEEIKLLELLTDGEALVTGFVGLENEGDDDYGNRSNGKVDVETPSTRGQLGYFAERGLLERLTSN